jgi:hypothetical protein
MQAGPSNRVALLVAASSAIPALLAWAAYGPLIVFDSGGYLGYAAALSNGTVGAGSALLHQSAIPITLFRMGGYPALLATLQFVFSENWLTALVLIQIIAQAAVAGGAYYAGRTLGIGQRLAVLAALIPTVGFALILQLCVLTDVLYGVLLSGAALLLVAIPRLASVVMASLALAAAMAMREATIVIALGYIPLALVAAGRVWPRRLAYAALVVGLPWCVAGAQVAWNMSRGVGAVLTTSPQTVLVQAVLPLVKAGYPVFDGDDLFDRTARTTLRTGDLGEIDKLHQSLFSQGMTATEMAASASQRYKKTWVRFPLAMGLAAISNLRARYLAMPLQPMETAGDLVAFAGGSRPLFTHLDHEWRLTRQGDFVAAGLVVFDLLTRTIGIAIAVAAIVGPWLPGGDPRCRALWCVCAGLIATYMPVHLEPRYLEPLTPLVCLLAAASCRDGGWRCAYPPYNIETQPTVIIGK